MRLATLFWIFALALSHSRAEPLALALLPSRSHFNAHASNSTERTARTGQDRTGQDRTVRAGQREQDDSHNGTGRTGQTERTGRIGQAEQDRQNRTGRTRQAEQGKQNRTARAGLPEKDRQSRTG